MDQKEMGLKKWVNEDAYIGKKISYEAAETEERNTANEEGRGSGGVKKRKVLKVERRDERRE